MGAGCFRSLLFVFVLFVDLAHLVNEATRQLGECQSASCTARSPDLMAIGAAVLGLSLLSYLVGCALLAGDGLASRPTWPLLLTFLLAFAAQIVGIALAAYGGAVVREPAD